MPDPWIQIREPGCVVYSYGNYHVRVSFFFRSSEGASPLFNRRDLFAFCKHILCRTSWFRRSGSITIPDWRVRGFFHPCIESTNSHVLTYIVVNKNIIGLGGINYLMLLHELTGELVNPPRSQNLPMSCIVRCQI